MDGDSPIGWDVERTNEAMSELQRQLSALEDRRGRRTASLVSLGELGGESVDDPNPMDASINLREVVHLRHLSQQPRAETSAATVATEASSVFSTSSFGALSRSYLVEPLQRHGRDASSVDEPDDLSVAVIAPMRAAQATDDDGDDDANDGGADSDGIDVEELRGGAAAGKRVSFGELGGESVIDPNPMDASINLHEVVHLRHLSQPRAETSAATVATEASSVCSTSTFGALSLSYLVEPLQRHGRDASSVDEPDDLSVAVIAPMRAAQATDDDGDNDANDGGADSDGIDVEELRGGAARKGDGDGGAAAAFLDHLLVGAADDVTDDVTDDAASDRAIADGWSSVVGAASVAGSIDEERDMARISPTAAPFSGCFSALMGPDGTSIFYR